MGNRGVGWGNKIKYKIMEVKKYLVRQCAETEVVRYSGELIDFLTFFGDLWETVFLAGWENKVKYKILEVKKYIIAQCAKLTLEV